MERRIEHAVKSKRDAGWLKRVRITISLVCDAESKAEAVELDELLQALKDNREDVQFRLDFIQSQLPQTENTITDISLN